jgi:glycerophosphoryl diester phosphodiesterase
MTRATPDWLIARPIAHRGLHDKARGVIENSLRAAQAAIAGRYAIECDVQMSSDGEAMVFHDYVLDRLTSETGPVAARTAAQLEAITLKDAPGAPEDRIAPLPAFLDAIDGRTPLIIEIKTGFDADMRLADRVATLVAARAAPIAIKSFDPRIIAHLRAKDARIDHVPLGIVAEANYEQPGWARLSAEERRAWPALVDFAQTRPDFLSFNVRDLPHAAPHLFRAALGKPVMTWTVRDKKAEARARQWADQIVFEGLTPA